MQLHQTSVELFWQERKRVPSCQDPTWPASQLLDKPISLRLHHRPLPLLQYFGHALDRLRDAKGRQESQAGNPWPFPSLPKDALAGAAKSQADDKAVQSLGCDFQQSNSADSRALADCFNLCSVQATAFT